jgi:hypothetical protein
VRLSRTSSAVLVHANGRGSSFQVPIHDWIDPGELADRAVGAALEPPGGQLGKPSLDQVQPRAVGGREVHVEAGMGQQPAPDGRVLWVEELSTITCTSNSAGSAWSMRARNRLNPTARCRGVIWETTRPEARFSAAYRLVVPWRA